MSPPAPSSTARATWKHGHKKDCSAEPGPPQAATASGSSPFLSEATSLKDAGNVLLKDGDFEGAKALYIDAKALSTSAAARLRQVKATDVEGDDDAGIVSELEQQLVRVGAVSAVNFAVASRQLAEATDIVGECVKFHMAAAASAREALYIDPTYADKALASLQRSLLALHAIGVDNQLKGLANAVGVQLNIFRKCTRDMPGQECRLLLANLCHSKLFYRYERTRFARELRGPSADSRQKGWFGKGPSEQSMELFPTLRGWSTKAPDGGSSAATITTVTPFWGQAECVASLVPVRDQQWLCLSLRPMFQRHNPAASLDSLRLRPADRRASADAIDKVKIPHQKVSRGASRVAAQHSRRAIPEFVADVEKCGLAVRSVMLGAGLFGLFPKPRPDHPIVGQMMPSTWSAESFPDAMDPHALPLHCEAMLAPNHVARDMQHEMAGLVASGGVQAGGCPTS